MIEQTRNTGHCSSFIPGHQFLNVKTTMTTYFELNASRCHLLNFNPVYVLFSGQICPPFNFSSKTLRSVSDKSRSNSTNARYSFCADSAFFSRRTTSLLVNRKLETSTLSTAFRFMTSFSFGKSRNLFFGFEISTTNGLPPPSIRASTSSLPEAWKEVFSPSVASKSGFETSSSTDSGYIFPVPLHFSQPLPRQLEQNHFDWGMSRTSFLYRPATKRGFT